MALEIWLSSIVTFHERTHSIFETLALMNSLAKPQLSKEDLKFYCDLGTRREATIKV
jgi:hypothetical protein